MAKNLKDQLKEAIKNTPKRFTHADGWSHLIPYYIPKEKVTDVF